MKNLVPLPGVAFLLLATATCLAVAPEGAAKPPAAPENTALVAAANNAFAADLYGKLAAKEGNLFFSPNSIETALVMTYAGARGRTSDQMAQVLHLPRGNGTAEQIAAVLHMPAKNGSIHSAFSAFLKELTAEKGPDGKPRGYQLSVANALWRQKGFTFLPAFLDLVKTNYGAGLNDVDFAKDTEGARKIINTWVEKETRDKIKDLIKPGILDPRATVLVLTNAIYFKGDWAAKFKKVDTEDKPFHLSADKTVTVPMMNREGKYGYMEDESFQALRLPYTGDDLAMIVLLPKKVDGLGKIEKSLTAENLAKWLSKMQTQKVLVAIPKFKTTAEFELKDTLAAMGMSDAFSGDVDFSGMDGKKDLSISNVIHKAFVDVNEEGTEAAAATAVIVGRSNGGHSSTPVFRADHPFIFLIRHEASGAILFMGRLADPTK